MKKLIATLIVGTVLAGCGGASQKQLAQTQCAKWMAEARATAQKFAGDLPTAPPAADTQALTIADYRVLALRGTHGYHCTVVR